jgi:hypothetical protein
MRRVCNIKFVTFGRTTVPIGEGPCDTAQRITSWYRISQVKIWLRKFKKVGFS